jgi:hypothetical protein
MKYGVDFPLFLSCDELAHPMNPVSYNYFFGGSAFCYAYFIKVIRRTVPRNNTSWCLFYILPLHVSALVGHLQAEYTIILGSYCNYNGSVVYLICVRELFKFAQITSMLNVKTLKY